MPPPLPGPLAQLAPLLDDYGYLAVGVLVFLDNCVIPVPGQTILVLAAVYAGAGQLSLPVVLTVAVLAAFAGNGLAYLIGRTGGLAFVHRWGRYLRLTPERLARAEDFFRRRGTLVVTGARFVDGLRQTNGVVAGTTGMPWRRFLPANAAGAVLWAGVWTAIGYSAGSNITVLYRQAVRYQVLLLIAVLAVLALVASRAWLRHRRRRRPVYDAGSRIPHQDSGEDVPADGRH
ncbi:DedA family protein [Kitasatospora sp. CB01950]|uniref:DedA family protein n=1 Tax=Kitasatospora sp. CB01950 TaxID=1703930 RepID=UPI00093A9344|nr:DedA family protein [Kitasatospora sp. CB01950]OKJ13697.1 alkaline phosphatase [Kitasatospora sp. CB01950]